MAMGGVKADVIEQFNCEFYLLERWMNYVFVEPIGVGIREHNRFNAPFNVAL